MAGLLVKWRLVFNRAASTIMVLILLGGCVATVDPAPGPPDSPVVLSHETTREIAVWAPPGEGPWPVVYALHGLGGSHQAWAEIATRLASQGVLVFAADYRSVEGAAEGRWDYVEQDTECGYRFVRSIANDYGGDLNQPVTMVGHSMGATRVLEIGLNEAAFGPGGTYTECLAGEPRPEVIVAIAGCHYEFAGYDFGFSTAGWTNKGANLVFIAGEEDAVCEAWQSEDAGDELRSAGYLVEHIEIAGANHFTPIFGDFIGDQWVTIPDEPAGQEVVQTILDAIEKARD